MTDTKDEVKPRDSFSFWNEKAKGTTSPPSLSPREFDHGPKSMPSGHLTDKVKLIEQALGAKPKLGLGPASSPPAPNKEIKKDKKLDKEDDDKEPIRKGSRTAQTPTIGKRDLTGSGSPSPTATRVPMIPNIVSSPMFDKKIKSAAQANKTLTSPHRVPEDENDFGTSSMPGTPSTEREDANPAAARKTLSSDSPRLKKLIRVKSMGSPMDAPLINRKDKTEQLVLGEYSLKNSVSEPALNHPGSEGGSLSDDDSSAEDIELVDDNSSNNSSNVEEGRRESVVSDEGNLPDIDLAASEGGEQPIDPEKLQMLQEKITLLQDEAEKLNSLISDLKIPLSDLEGDQNAMEDTKSKIAEKEGELKKLTEQLGELMQEKGIKKKRSTRTLSRSGSFNNSKKKKRSTLKRSKSGHLSDGKVKRKKRVRDLVTEVEADKKIVKGGSVIELVNAFAKKDIKDFDYVESFILTHQTFMTSDLLVDLLIEKYKSAPEEKDNSSSARSALETMDSSTDSNTSSPGPSRRKSKYSRRRILNLMRMWIVKCPQDFIKFNNVPFFEKVRTFISNAFDETRSPIAQDALDILDGKKDLSLPSAEMVFSPAKPINMKGNKPGALPEFMEWNEKEVAKQLTMWTHELFKKIKPSECFGKGWSKGEEYASEKAPNIWQMIQRFNQVSTWVATEIVKQDLLKQRVQVVKKFLLIAQHCRELNNLETAMAFVSGLQSTSVDRLKETWKKIEAKPKLWTIFQDLVKLFDSESNFQEYRNAMKSIVNSPAIPYLGLSLRTLTYIEDGNENDFGKKLNRKDLINFDKRRKLAHVVADLIKWQNTAYAIEKDLAMIKYLESAETFNDTLLWKQSLVCEARKGKSANTDI